MLDDLNRIGKAEGYRELHLILWLVLPVAAAAFRLPKYRGGQALFPCQLGHIVDDAVFITEVLRGELTVHLVPETEGDPGVDHRLTLHHVHIVGGRDVDVCKDLQIGLPAEDRPCLFSVGGGLLQSADVFTLFEVQLIFKAVPVNRGIKIFAGVLGGTRAKAVEAQGVLIIFPLGVILAAGVQLTEHQLPVIATFLLVPVHRASPAKVLHLNGVVGKAGDDDQLAVALPRFVDGVGHDLKNRVLAAIQSIRAKNDPRTLSDAVCSLQGRDRFVVILFALCRHISKPLSPVAKFPRIHYIW